MPKPKEVTSVRSFDDVRFEREGGTTAVRVTEFFIGRLGPFRLEHPKGEASAELINREMEAEVRRQREIGALTGD